MKANGVDTPGASPHVVHFELDRSNMASRMDRVPLLLLFLV